MYLRVILFSVLLGWSESLFITPSSGFAERLFEDAATEFIDGLYELYADEEGTLIFPKYSSLDDSTLTEARDGNYSDPLYTSVEVEGLGTAVGVVLETYLGDPFLAFQGIRYATADTFQMPIADEEPWGNDFMGGFDATYLKDRCAQSSLVFPVISGSEDCLHVSVYTPLDIESKTYPVMVWIHGGAYISGDATLYIPSKLLQKDVIVVTVQYRLGSLGFLYSGSESAPGNMGLMDQVLALRWVKKYIGSFGGQVDNVTVFGQSAGGASTSWMQLTPQTSAEWNDGTQLLQRVIPQSGSALEVWTLDHESERSLILHANATGCYNEGDTSDELVACMAELPSDDLARGYLKVYVDDRREGGLGFLGMAPVVQTELLELVQGTDQEQELIVIPREPLDMIANEEYRKVDVMTGSVRDEGSLVVGISYTDYLLPTGLIDDEYYLKVGIIPLLVSDFEISDKTDAVANSFRLGFLPNVEMGNWTQMSPGLVDLGGMLFLKSGLWKMTRLQTENKNDNKIFFYSFEFESDDSIFDWYYIAYPDIPVEGGVTHADELLYLFSLPALSDDREKETIDKLTTLWANFATYGDPTPDSDVASWVELTQKWDPYTLENLEFLLMQDEFSMGNDFVTRWNYNILE